MPIPYLYALFLSPSVFKLSVNYSLIPKIRNGNKLNATTLGHFHLMELSYRARFEPNGTRFTSQRHDDGSTLAIVQKLG